jgi:GT2 family glycosyltransferase
MSARVLVSLVTCNSARYLRACLESLARQSWRDFTVRLWDNASTDDSVEIARRHATLVEEIQTSERNLGFCAAHNRLITGSGCQYVLVLNPDVVLDAGFLEVLVAAMDSHPEAGSSTGKLWRWTANMEQDPGSTPPAAGQILDSTGIYMTRNQRHFDRAAGESDQGQHEMSEYVFGASGAAALYRRAMLEDTKAGEEYFDESFFAYREDADLAWRAQWLGWKCLYVPQARAWHVRRVLPERRAALPALINMHSFKNRFLLRVKNMDAGTYLRFLIPITARDLAAIVYVVLRERTSLPAFSLLRKHLPRAWRLRCDMRHRRRITPREMRSWFSHRPVSTPVTQTSAR